MFFAMTGRPLWLYAVVFFVAIFGRYLVVAGGTHLLLYTGLRRFFPVRELRNRALTRSAVLNEVWLSAASAVVFALCGAFIMSSFDSGRTLLYSDAADRGWWYLCLSFPVVLVLQDAYFYGTHRLFHHPALYKRFHRGHHRSGDPSPWSSFAFDLPEAFVHALFLVAVALLIPLHFGVLFAVLLTMTVWAVINHLGYEYAPPESAKHPIGRWLVGPTHHALHHRRYTVHYALYFTWLDKLFGSEVPEYEEKFDSLLRK